MDKKVQITYWLKTKYEDIYFRAVEGVWVCYTTYGTGFGVVELNEMLDEFVFTPSGREAYSESDLADILEFMRRLTETRDRHLAFISGEG